MEKFSLRPIPPGPELEKLRTDGSITLVDGYDEQLLELFLIRNPQYRFDKNYQEPLNAFLQEQLGGRESQQHGSWFFFPWNRTVVHVLPEQEFLELRTARNRNLISAEEQEKFYRATVAVAGLSVGSHGALTIAMTGGAQTFKLADFDTISVSNLNRLRYGVTAVGQHKAEYVARLIAEINPYSEIYLYREGITDENLSSFIAGGNSVPKADILLEGVDNLLMKIRLREAAKTTGVPVLMATDNGDGIIVDIERYDLDPQLLLFNGALGQMTAADFKDFPPTELPKLATKVAGPEYIVPRMLASLLEVGKTLYSWPQLGTAATFTGVASAYLVRAIVNGGPIPSGKFDINLQNIFSDALTKKQTETATQELLKQMGL